MRADLALSLLILRVRGRSMEDEKYTCVCHDGGTGRGELASDVEGHVRALSLTGLSRKGSKLDLRCKPSTNLPLPQAQRHLPR